MQALVSKGLEQFHTIGNDKSFTILGCHPGACDGRQGYLFRVWAPHAKQVSVVGDFNFWNGSDLPMKRLECGVWEAFSLYAKAGGRYKYRIWGAAGGEVDKADPYGFQFGVLPDFASIICDPSQFAWEDKPYLKAQNGRTTLDRPVNIYEIHAGSWKRCADGNEYSYRELADLLVPYVKDMGYTHIELMPITEYPFIGSWGYQVTGYFAPTSRYGSPDDFRYLVNACHKAGIGVILDWVPAHFPKDSHGLYEFDGTCLYELSDPQMNEHPDWTTRIFDYGKPEVVSFLTSSAVYWLTEYHIDGIRVDAVASMLYLDYNRPNYKPNKYGGRENLEAIAFLKKLNHAAFQARPNVLMIAEESTTFPKVTKPDYDGGLGFLYKWNMGWMNDILKYMSLDPLFRKGNHDKLTFSMTYAYSENFILPLSHDEVVHGKHALIEKMPGDYHDKFSNLRVLFAFLMAHPGKKLQFMGNEFGQFIEWDYQKELDWFLLDYEKHKKLQTFSRDLNHFYLEHPPLWRNDQDWNGFQWINPDDRDNSIISFRRIDRRKQELLVICNFCPIIRNHYRLGVPRKGSYVPVFCTDDEKYGGWGFAPEVATAKKEPLHGLDYSADFTVPPMSVTFYQHVKK